MIARVRTALAELGADAWMAHDFAGSNPPAREALGLAQAHLTRRFFYFVPREGAPWLVAAALEADRFAHLPGEVAPYRSRLELLAALERAVERWPRLAVPLAPGGHVPYLDRLGAGLADLLRGLGAELVSDAAVLLALARWSPEDLAAHRRAAAGLAAARDAALAFLRRRLPNDPPRELEVQAVLVRAIEAAGLVFDHPPIVAFGDHAARPHYAPAPGRDRRLAPGEVVLLDLWGQEPGRPYADITWMAGWAAPPAAHRAFDAVARARDAVVRALARPGRRYRGFELDRIAREVLTAAGYRDAILHRTGHSLGRRSPHGDATHLDDLETHDTRSLLPGLGFTVEPGVYPGPFGVRSEINVYLSEEGPRVTTDVEAGLEELAPP